MASATVLSYFNTPPQVEVVTLTVTDGETYDSRKFQNIFGAICTQNENNDYEMNIVITTDSVAINLNGAIDKVCTLELYGKIQEDSP